MHIKRGTKIEIKIMSILESNQIFYARNYIKGDNLLGHDPLSHMHPWRIHVMWEVELAWVMQDPSSFILCPPGVSSSPVPSIAAVLRSLLRLSINAFIRDSSSTHQSLTSNQTWISSTTRGQRVSFRDCLHTLFKEKKLSVGPLES